ncbi:MAG: patatin-like phospholipase family protein [Desulfomonile tiedjei]|uniref:Patatin-like phospholipase family protein n=1 Tax=Desulfomonile tiedjei TaxID=2358 RepID=A0A9D6UZM5_9BACT|nr:patatin-like phospholipase family protein [Desulfomonile tiedjei]
MKDYIQFKAGPKILSLIRDEGLDPARIGVLAGPAGGPKWFVSVGFDRMLMESRLLERKGSRVLLAGSSAGAWRCLAMACKNAPDAYEKLRIAYSRNVFTAADTPASLSEALRGNVDAFLSDVDIEHILAHPVYDVAVHTVRAKGPAASEKSRIQGPALLVAAGLNAITSRAMDLFFQRVAFFSGPKVPNFAASFNGCAVRLDRKNLRRAALATGSLPYIIKGVENISGAPLGVYRDGGLIDYQLNQDYCPGADKITLFFHYQERIVPGWFDKHVKWRNPPSGSLDRVLQVYPGADFVELLPDHRLPDRQDFTTFVNDPMERIRRWDRVSELSDILGREFLESVESGQIKNLVKPL